METIKSIIKKIDRVIPLKETAISLLVCFILLILIEYIWDGSVARLLNMQFVIVAVIILAYLIISIILIQYIRRSMRIQTRNVRRLRARMLEDQGGHNAPAKTVINIVPPLLLILPIILLVLIAVETIWENSVSYYINLNALIISTIVTECIALLAILFVLYGRHYDIRKIKTKKLGKTFLAFLAPRIKRGVSELKLGAATEKQEEEERRAEFKERLPRINRIPVIRWFIGWMYREGWFFSVALILLIFLGGYIRLANIDNPQIHHDEFITVSVVQGYLNTGDFVLWDSVNNQPIGEYPRSFVYTWMVAQSVKVFGFDELGLRFPTAIFGTLTIILVYFVFKKFTSKDIALIAAVAFTFNNYAIYLSRFARSYAVFLFVFLLLVYVIYSCIEEAFKIGAESKVGRKDTISQYRMFIGYAVLSVLLFFFSYHLSPLTILIVIPVFIYICVKLIYHSIHSRTVFTLQTKIFLCFSLLILAIFALDYFGFINVVGTKNIIETHFGTGMKPQTIYYRYLFGPYKSRLLVQVLAILGVLFLLLKFKMKGLYVLLIGSFSLIMMIYFFDRYEDFRYILPLIPFAILTISVGLVGLVSLAVEVFTVMSRQNVRTVLKRLTYILALLLLIISPSFPGLNLPPITHVAQADWTGDDGLYYIHRRAVAGQVHEAFNYVNNHIENDDALLLDADINSFFYFNHSSEADAYFLQRSGNISVVRSELYDQNASVSFWDIIGKYDRVWVISLYIHLQNTDVANYLIQHAENYAADAGIMQFDYNSWYTDHADIEFYWPNIFLIQKDTTP